MKVIGSILLVIFLWAIAMFFILPIMPIVRAYWGI